MKPECLYIAGVSSYARGDRRRAARYCARALRDDAAGDALTVRLAHLYLIATELWWNSPAPEEDVSALVERAQEAARRSGEPALRAMAGCMYGRHLIATGSLPGAAAVFSDAAEMAKASGSLLAELEALCDLGHHTVGLNLDRGLGILRRAQAVADAWGDGVPPSDRPLVQVQKAKLAGLVGVAEFDDGRFDEAENWLRRSVAELKSLHAWDHAALIFNYFGQLLTEMGRFEEAEHVLLEALEPLQADADLSTFQGYNLGLLGKLYLDCGRIGAAAERIRAGWVRLLQTRHMAIVPILRNYLGELYMHPSYEDHDVYRARELFDETIVECQQTGFQRSEITALALHALADLDLGDTAGSLAASERAVERLAAAGTMPTVRTEEIYIVRYIVLRAAGADSEAAGWLARARVILDAKAATISSPLLREQFLARPPVSRAVMSGSSL